MTGDGSAARADLFTTRAATCPWGSRGEVLVLNEAFIDSDYHSREASDSTEMQGFSYGPGRDRTYDLRIMSPLL